jgi:hypothetical protein
MSKQRWFLNIDDNGSVDSVYRSDWDGSRIVSEEVWSNKNAAWQRVHTISYWNFLGDYRISEVTAAEASKYLPPVATQKTIEPTQVKGVSGPLEVARALSRLAILPNPNHPDLDEPEKFVESPWEIVTAPTVDPNAWADAEVVIVDLADLYGTDKFLRRKNVARHVENMGQALTPFRSWAMVADFDGRQVIIDGHHRLLALWLLGHDRAPVYKIEVD